MIRIAKVVNINDELEQGRIKIRIFPEMESLKEEDLPWARPMMSVYEKKNCIPEVDKILYVEINDDWTSFYYLDSIKYIISEYNYEEIKTILSEIEEISSFSYPNPDFRMNPNGFIEFFNKENSETGFIHPSGTYVVFKENGDYYIKNPEMFELHFSNGMLEIKNVTSIKFGEASDSGVLFSPLKEILDKIFTHTHSFSYSAGPTPAVGTTSASTQISTLSSDGIESSLIKLD